MKFMVCAVYDIAVQAYAQPIFTRSRLEAMRSFEDACRGDKDTMFVKHANDYALFQLGTYDDNTGKLESDPTPTRLMTATEVRLMVDMERGVEVIKP